MRRFIQGLAALVVLVAAVATTDAPRAEPLATADALADRVLGDPNAPITIIEYSSLTCPHCASFHAETLGKLKEDYIDTGKVKLIYRDFPFDAVGLRAAMLARCSNPDRYFGFLDVLFKTQEKWSRDADPIGALRNMAKLAGVTEEEFDACMANTELQDGILARRIEAQQQFGVSSTPTFIINDGAERVVGARPIEEFRKILDKLSS